MAKVVSNESENVDEDMFVSQEVEIGDKLKLPCSLVTKTNTLSQMKENT